MAKTYCTCIGSKSNRTTRGGGDFSGIGEEDVGCWAGDLIETQDVRPVGYQDVTADVNFQETYC